MFYQKCNVMTKALPTFLGKHMTYISLIDFNNGFEYIHCNSNFECAYL